MTRNDITRWLGTLGLGLFLTSAPLVASAAPQTSANPPAELAPAPSSDKTPEEVSRRQLHYAEREAQNPNAAAFKGGEGGLYIGGSAVAVVLLIVLLVVLL
jgi:hypothetical protein